MAYLEVNGFPCVRGQVVMPLSGAWVADVVAETEGRQGSFPAPGASVTLTIGQQNLAGTVRRGNSPFGTTWARVIAGAAGLPSDLPAKSYSNPTVKQVLSDILKACGETLSQTSDQSLLNTSMPFWMRLAQPGWQCLANLIASANPAGTWRVLPDGTVWVGTDSWPQTGMGDFELLEYWPQELKSEFYSDNPSLLTGQLWLGGKVTSVEHFVEPGKIKATALFLDEQLVSVEASNG